MPKIEPSTDTKNFASHHSSSCSRPRRNIAMWLNKGEFVGTICLANTKTVSAPKVLDLLRLLLLASRHGQLVIHILQTVNDIPCVVQCELIQGRSVLLQPGHGSCRINCVWAPNSQCKVTLGFLSVFVLSDFSIHSGTICHNTLIPSLPWLSPSRDSSQIGSMKSASAFVSLFLWQESLTHYLSST